MTAVFQLHANELSDEVMQAIKKAFAGKEIVLTVAETPDETNYLLSSETNKVRLMQSVEAVNKGTAVSMTLEEFQQQYGQ